MMNDLAKYQYESWELAFLLFSGSSAYIGELSSYEKRPIRSDAFQLDPACLFLVNLQPEATVPL
jgi:hypothetical protein